MSSPQGNTVREERVTSDRLRSQQTNDEFPLGIKTPLEEGKKRNESLFRMNYRIEDQINDNLKNLLMTKKGEKLCFSDYGTRLYAIYSSDASMDQIYASAMQEISQAVSKYMPSISLVKYYSKLLNDKEEMLRILDDPTQVLRLESGHKFHEAQSSLTLSDKGSIEKKGISKNSDVIYQITVEYSIPMLKAAENKIYSLTMNLLTSE